MSTELAPPLDSDVLSLANATLLAKRGELVGTWAGLAEAPAEGFGPLEFEALTICANFESFGASVDAKTARALSWQDMPTLERVYHQAESALRKASGAHRSFEPMYPNFPKQVIDADDQTLLRNALLHYGSVAAGARELPRYQAISRESEKIAGKGLRFAIVGEEAAFDAMSSLAKSNSAMSPADREAMVAFARAFGNMGKAPQAAAALTGGSNKENLAHCAVACRELGEFASFASSLSVCTDALRVACALSGGDASLAAPTKFGKLTRSERRALLAVVERHLSEGDSAQAMENLFSRREAWLRLGERIHPGEFKKSHPLAGMAFEDLRSGKAPQPFPDRLLHATAGQDIAAAVKLLRSRPGEFCRRAAATARALGPASHEALSRGFDGCADKVSTPVLLQAMSAFESAAAAVGAPIARAFMPKGGMGKIYLRGDGSDKAIDPAFAVAMRDSCKRALSSRFSKFAPLGKVYVDPALDKVNAPFAARSASRQTKTLARGSRVPVEGKVARLFAWWSERGVDKDGARTASSRIDIDLSCLFLGADFKPMGHVSWTMLRDGSAVVYSGDITSAPNGACEFIDVEYDKLDPAIKYVAMTIHSFTGQSFDEMPECFAGWMGREAGMKGKLFDARAVRGKSDVAMAACSAMPVFLDVDAKEAIWADLALPKGAGYSMVERLSKTIGMAAQALATTRKPTMGTLARLHAQARGTLVSTPEEADVVFGLEQGFTPYDFELIASELLADSAPLNPKIKKPEPALPALAESTADSPMEAAAPKASKP